MLRPLRLMQSALAPSSSPKRVFSASSSHLLRTLDSASSSASSGADDPFGSDWPSREKADMAETDAPAIKPIANLAMRSSAKLKMMDGSSVPSSKQPLSNNTSQPSSRPTPTEPPPPRKPVSTRSKENGIVQSNEPVSLKPELVHPLPIYSYKEYKPAPTRVYVRQEEEANTLVESLSGAVGFDLEWKVVFRRGENTRPAATVQLSDKKTILVIQVSAMKAFPKKLKEILENPKVSKVGANIHNDGKKLATDYNVHAQGLVELGGLARQADVHYVERYFRASALPSSSSTAQKRRKPGKIISLATITAMYTGRTLPKGPVRVSNWEVQPLSEIQLEYAANDAHCALMVYDHLITMTGAASVKLQPARYTSSVVPHHVHASGGSSAAPPPAPASITAAPSSSSFTSVSSSGYSASSSSSAASTSTLQSRLVTAAFNSTSLSSFTSTSLTKTEMALSASFAGVGDSDWEVLEARDYRTEGRTLSKPHLNISLPSTSALSSGGPSPDPPRRPGPRFKPSHNNIMSIAPSSSTTPISQRRTDDPTASSSAQPPSTRLLQPLRTTNQRPQHIRAYNLWHVSRMSLDEMCGTLRSPDNPLKRGTVITYVIGALRADPKLHFSRERLRALINSDGKSWMYYGPWFGGMSVRKYVNMDTK